MIGFYNYTVYATYLSLLSAMLGLCLTVQGRLEAAVLCLLFSGGLDMIDGRIARTHKSRSRNEKRFGVQIDSLSDLVAFGVLPAVIGFKLGAHGVVAVGLLLFFALACLIRLAYFNVLAAAEEDNPPANSGFRGLPAPSSALAAPLIFCFRPLLASTTFTALYVAALTLVGVAYIWPFTMAKPGGKLQLAMAVIGAVFLCLLMMRIL